MDDRKIIELFFERSEKAIEESQKKYGRYISAVADSVLASKEDAEEVVSDTYLRTWNSIPPQKPKRLGVHSGYTSEWKKAIVQLTEDSDTIEFFEGMR